MLMERRTLQSGSRQKEIQMHGRQRHLTWHNKKKIKCRITKLSSNVRENLPSPHKRGTIIILFGGQLLSYSTVSLGRA